MIRDGVKERVAMLLCGWETRSVLDRYNIVSDQDLREAASLLGRLFADLSGWESGAEGAKVRAGSGSRRA